MTADKRKRPSVRAVIRRFRAPGRSILLLGAVTFIGALMNITGQIILARSLGPADFGLILMGLAAAGILAPIGALGVGEFWLQATGEEGRAARRWIRPALKAVVTASGAIAAGFVLVALAGHGANDFFALLPAFVPVLWLVALCNLVMARAQIAGQLLTVGLARQSMAGIRFFTALTVLALGVGGAVQTAFIIWGIGAAGTVWAAWHLVSHLRSGFTGAADRTRAGEDESVSIQTMLGLSWPFVASSLMYMVYFQSDILLLGFLDSEAASGRYGVAVAVLSAFYLFPSVIYAQYLLPKLHRLTYQDPVRFRRIYGQGTLIMTLAGLIFAAGLIWFHRDLIRLFFGPAYDASAPLLLALSVCVPLRYAAQSAGSVLATGRRAGTMARIQAGTALLNLAANLALIPWIGVWGAVASTIACEAVNLALFHLFARRALERLHV